MAAQLHENQTLGVRNLDTHGDVLSATTGLVLQIADHDEFLIGVTAVLHNGLATVNGVSAAEVDFVVDGNGLKANKIKFKYSPLFWQTIDFVLFMFVANYWILKFP